MSQPDDEIQARTIGDYLDALSSSAPAPGGGSVAGLIGALAASLAEMVISLTRTDEPLLQETAEQLQALRASAMAFGAADELAYSAFVGATKMSKATQEDTAHRSAMMQAALEEAATVPLELAGTSIRLLELLGPLVRLGSKHVLSDAAIAITLALACLDCSLINVRVNLPMITNAELAGSLRGKAQKAEQHAHALAGQLRSELAQRR